MPLPLIYIFHPYIRYIYNYYIVHIIAWSMSKASAPRTSPTIIRSGRMRRDDLIRSLIVMLPLPSVFAFLVSSRTRFFIEFICSSAESSIVIIRSSGLINCERAFRKVVLPEPVPPLTMILYFAFTAALRKSAAYGVIAFHASSSSKVSAFSENFLIVTIGPLRAMGYKTMLTREPSCSLASHIGFAVSTVRLTFETMR